MFKVQNINTGEVTNVYHVNGTYFLLWNTEEQAWVYDDMSNYKPLED